MQFHPASTYEGPRAGYVFQTGASGVGYYRDTGMDIEEEEEEDPVVEGGSRSQCGHRVCAACPGHLRRRGEITRHS